MPSFKQSQPNRNQPTNENDKEETHERVCFSFAHIVLTAAITAGLGFVVLIVLHTRWMTLRMPECLVIAILAGFSVLIWRSVGNTSALNNDPIPGVSPNDVLTPLVTYLLLGMYAAFRRPPDLMRFEQACVWLLLVSLVVNVVTI